MTKDQIEEYRKMVAMILEDENYDMYDDFDNETIIQFVLDVIPMVFHIKDVTIGDCNVRLNSQRNGSFVSVSDDEYTGVARCCCYIFENRFRPTEDDIRTMLSMVNEAWYACKNEII